MDARGDGIFISYRRSDAQFAAGRLADALVREFGATRIFRDIDDIEAGADFVEALDLALSNCAVMLVVIGGQWLDARDANGQRRIDMAGDWVRQEIARALQRGIRVVPVLLERTEMPGESVLPDELKVLARRQALALADAQWLRDVAALIAAVRPHLGTPTLQTTAAQVRTQLEAGARTGIKWALRVLLVVGALVIFLTYLTIRSCNSDPPDLTGAWRSSQGWTVVFAPQADGRKHAYRVAGQTQAGAALECAATPGYFGSVDLNCTVSEAGANADSFVCTGLVVSESPRSISGNCTWQRDSSSRPLSLLR